MTASSSSLAARGASPRQQPRSKPPGWFHPSRPFSPNRIPLFYGWVVLVVGTAGIIMSIPGQTTGVSVFTDPLIQATGLNRFWVSIAYLVGTATSGLILPLGGQAIDRFGVRRASMGAALGLALALLYLSQIDRVGQAFGGAWLTMLVVLTLGFTALRFSGQGMLTLSSRTMIGRWFDKKRGRVAARSGVFVSFSFSSAPQFLSAAIDAFSWREVWIGLAMGIGVVMTLLAYVFFREDPESVGQHMDGEPAATEKGAEAQQRYTAIRDYTRKEAVTTRAFWAVTCTLATQGLIITGFSFHIVDLGALAGLTRAEAVAFFLPASVVSVTVALIVGKLSEHVRVKSLLIMMAAFEALGVLAAANFHDPVAQALTVIGFGGAGGFFGPLTTLALPRYFGRAFLGSISGVQMMVLVLASSIGPSLLAAGKSLQGSYTVGMYGALVFVVGSLFLALSVREAPVRR